MSYKIEEPREVNWSNPHAFMVACETGECLGDLSRYGEFFERIGYESCTGNVLEFVDKIADSEFSSRFREIYGMVHKGEIGCYEMDFNMGPFHYHMTLSNLGNNVGISFNDQTAAVNARDAAKESAERGHNVIHALKNALDGMAVTDAVERHMEKGNYERAQRLIESLNTARDAVLSNAETLLNIERAEAGAPFLWDSHMYSKNIVEPVVSLLQPKFRTKGATYKREVSSDDDPLIFCDKRRMQSVFFHLIQNALSHGKEGLTVSTGQEPIVEEGREIGHRLVCWNTKSYVPPENWERVFDKFHGEGTGLGLHLVKNTIVNEHKGRISLESGRDETIGDEYTKIMIDLYSEDYLGNHGLEDE